MKSWVAYSVIRDASSSWHCYGKRMIKSRFVEKLVCLFVRHFSIDIIYNHLLTMRSELCKLKIAFLFVYLFYLNYKKGNCFYKIGILKDVNNYFALLISNNKS